MKYIVVLITLFVSLLMCGNSHAFTFYFGTAKTIKNARKNRVIKEYKREGIFFAYEDRHRFFHIYRGEAYWIDPKEPEMGSIFLGCGPTSNCPFYHHRAPTIEPYVPDPKCPFARYLMLPSLKDAQEINLRIYQSDYLD